MGSHLTENIVGDEHSQQLLKVRGLGLPRAWSDQPVGEDFPTSWSLTEPLSNSPAGQWSSQLRAGSEESQIVVVAVEGHFLELNTIIFYFCIGFVKRFFGAEK